MQYVCSAARKPDFWERFGRELAEMHIASTEDMLTGGRYGFPSDNYIGATRQINKPAESWIRFYRDRRLEYQYRKACHFLDQSDRKAMPYILDHLDQFDVLEKEAKELTDRAAARFMEGVLNYADELLCKSGKRKSR